MPVDPFAVLNALLRAEASRQNHRGERPEPERTAEPPAARTTAPVRSAEPEGRAD
ncbi:hypothetical protein ABZ135_07030 [Streptomyces sp. NPDC006339]|uniref:hypothetical protein n=1 Tax=Streptomyces sp. NPDC006339 TaxID=3156755 RepID=UPI0033A3E71C